MDAELRLVVWLVEGMGRPSQWLFALQRFEQRRLLERSA